MLLTLVKLNLGYIRVGNTIMLVRRGGGGGNLLSDVHRFYAIFHLISFKIHKVNRELLCFAVPMALAPIIKFFRWRTVIMHCHCWYRLRSLVNYYILVGFGRSPRLCAARPSHYHENKGALPPRLFIVKHEPGIWDYLTGNTSALFSRIKGGRFQETLKCQKYSRPGRV